MGGDGVENGLVLGVGHAFETVELIDPELVRRQLDLGAIAHQTVSTDIEIDGVAQILQCCNGLRQRAIVFLECWAVHGYRIQWGLCIAYHKFKHSESYHSHSIEGLTHRGIGAKEKMHTEARRSLHGDVDVTE